MFKNFIEKECLGYTIDFRYNRVDSAYIVKVTKEDKQATRVLEYPIDESDTIEALQELMAEVDQKLRDKEDMIQRKKDREKKV